MKFILREFSKLLAPSMPFIAEDLYGKISGGLEKESVHLENWPEYLVRELTEDGTRILENMKETRHVVSLGLETRAKSGMKVRQPLLSLKVKSKTLEGKEEFLELIKDEINVKEIIFDVTIAGDVELDLNITKELKEEGMVRDIIRAVQELRKGKGLMPGDQIELIVETDKAGKAFMEKFEKEIAKAAGVKKINFGKVENGEKLMFEAIEIVLTIKD